MWVNAYTVVDQHSNSKCNKMLIIYSNLLLGICYYSVQINIIICKR
ncbi:hypothetical protein B566_EDAN014332 [Ephemera danica]|nr:hypothetical protein B566_EDAN014332 [Ephemera danica]